MFAALKEKWEASKESARVQSSRRIWREYFSSIMISMLDYEQSEAVVEKRIALAARAADMALAETEQRWSGVTD